MSTRQRKKQNDAPVPQVTIVTAAMLDMNGGCILVPIVRLDSNEGVNT